MLKELPLPFTIPLLNRDAVSTYSIMLMLAFLTASYLIPRELRRRNLLPEISDWIILIGVAGAIIGAKLGFIFEIWHEIWLPNVTESFGEKMNMVFLSWRGMAQKYPGQATGLWESIFSGGGLVFYGGFIFTFTSIYLFLRLKKLDIWRYGDAFMPSLAIGYAIGRLGCLVSGDGCFGFAAGVNIPIITMVYGSGAVMNSAGVNVWNTPVIESIASASLFIFYMVWARHQNFKPGMLVAIFLMFNGLARFLVEFLRLNDAAIPILSPPTIQLLTGETVPLTLASAVEKGVGEAYYFQNWHWYGITQSQNVAILMMILGTAWLLIGKLYQKESTPAKSGKKGKKKK